MKREFLRAFWFPIALILTCALFLITSPRAKARTGGHEKTFIAYPGDCDDPAGWYMKDSDKTSVTLGCWQDDSDSDSDNPDR